MSAPISTPTPSGPSFRADIQGMRALAVIAVVLYHAGGVLPGGFVGVDVFFVLSGYVITRVLHRELERTGTVDLGRFALRRIRRILPALATLLVVVVPASVLVGPIGGHGLAVRTSIAASLFNANTYLASRTADYFSASAELNPLLHTWSLSVEEQFYLGFPALVAILWRLAGHRGVRWGLAAVSALSFLGSALLVADVVGFSIPTPIGAFGLDETFAFYGAPARAWEFGVGAILALAPSQLVDPRSSVALRRVGTAVLMGCVVLYDHALSFPGVTAVAPVVATAALIAAGERTTEAPPVDLVGRLIESRPMQWLGDVSYSWYLWHWPLIVFTRAAFTDVGNLGLVAAGVLSLVPARLSMLLVENPIRFAPVPPVRRTVALGLGCVLIPMLVAGVAAKSWATLHRSDLVAFDEAFGPHLDSEHSCDRAEGVDHLGVGERCRFETKNPQGLAILLGDSNAGHLSEAAVEGFGAAGFDVGIATMSACPFADATVLRDGTARRECGDFVEAALDEAIALAPDVVVLSSAIDKYVVEDDFVVSDPSGLSETEAEKRRALADAQGRIVERLRSAGIEVAVVEPVPRFGAWDPRECSILRWRVRAESCGEEIAADELAHQRIQVEGVGDAAREAGARVVDVATRLCDRERCRTRRGTTWAFRDGGHLSVDGSASLAPVFAELGETRR